MGEPRRRRLAPSPVRLVRPKMDENRGTRKSRAFVVTAAAAVIAVFALVLTGGLSALDAHGPTGTASHQSGLRVDTIGATDLYLNRSQGTAPYSTTESYVGEFVSLNNSSTLTRIPTLVTVKSATDCRWVTVLNLSTKIDTFDSVVYLNVTGANATGAGIIAGSFSSPATKVSFNACGGSAYYVNFGAQAYHIYNFAATTLGLAANVTQTKTTYSGATVSTASIVYSLAAKGTLTLKIPAHEAFDLTFPAYVNGSTTCDVTEQICSYPSDSFVSATNGANVTKTGALTFFASNSTASAYSNWTIDYKSGTASADTIVGGFFGDVSSGFTSYFVDLWYVWVVALLGVAVVVLLARSGRSCRR